MPLQTQENRGEVIGMALVPPPSATHSKNKVSSLSDGTPAAPGRGAVAPEGDEVGVLVVQLSGVVVHHVQDDLDARVVQPAAAGRGGMGVGGCGDCGVFHSHVCGCGTRGIGRKQGKSCRGYVCSC